MTLIKIKNTIKPYLYYACFLLLSRLADFFRSSASQKLASAVFSLQYNPIRCDIFIMFVYCMAAAAVAVVRLLVFIAIDFSLEILAWFFFYFFSLDFSLTIFNDAFYGRTYSH